MEKPFELTIIDTKENIVNIINQSNLPLSIISMILNELNLQVNNSLNLHITKLREQYNNNLNNET